jgi:hypothetical protein
MSDAVTTLRSRAPLPPNWSEEIEEDFKKRGGKRSGTKR